MKKKEARVPLPKTIQDLLKPQARQQGALANAKSTGQMEIKAAGDDVHELIIYGDIGDSWWGEDSVTAKAVISELQNLDTSHLVVCINSYGGSVSDGLAIYNAIRRKSDEGVKVTTRIEGVAVSIASFIAMAADDGEVQAHENSLYMVHAPWSYAMGNAVDMREAADVLDTYADSMISAYQRHTLPGVDVEGMLKDGEDHWFTAESALSEGFVQVLLNDEEDGKKRYVAPGREDDEEEQLDEGGSETTEEETEAGAQFLTDLQQRYPGVVAFAHAQNIPLSIEPAAAAAKPTQEAIMPDSKKPAATKPEDNVVALEDAKKQGRAEALAAEQGRRADIRAVFKKHLASDGMPALQDECLDDPDCSLEDARAKLLDQIGSMMEPVNRGNGTVVDMGRAAMLDGMRTAVMARISPSTVQHTENSKRFIGMSLSEMARASLEQAGVNTVGMSKPELAIKALHSTGDFPVILENAVNKTLRDAYEITPRTFTQYCNRAVLPDFKDVTRAQIAGAPGLEKVGEGAEYTQGTIGEGAEKYRVFKYGREIAISWETIVNDDMDALGRIPRSFGAASADLESDIVYGLFKDNAKMGDGTALFHASHKNLITGSDITIDGLSAGRKAMREQRGLPSEKGDKGRLINLQARFLLVPAALETAAQKMLATNVVPATQGEHNPFAGSLDLIVDPRLDEASTKEWYLIADPARVDTIEYAYLEGHEGVQTSSRIDDKNDSLIIKARHVFGAKAIDHRGLVKNPGTA